MNNLETFVILDLDHPGAQDKAYKLRRNKIAELANKFWQSGGNGTVPMVDYHQTEHATWKLVAGILNVLWGERASEIYLEGQKALQLDLKVIPNMVDLNFKLHKLSGMKLKPVAGLVESRAFLSRLERQEMLCTQYIRHASKPEFTPEPDIIHEFLGHVPTFVNPQIVRISKMLGGLAAIASSEVLAQIEKIYWFALEYGLIEEKGKIKALGAGLLAGIEDQNRAFSANADLREFNLEEIMETPYNFAEVQQFYYVLPSLDFLEKQIQKLL